MIMSLSKTNPQKNQLLTATKKLISEKLEDDQVFMFDSSDVQQATELDCNALNYDSA